MKFAARVGRVATSASTLAAQRAREMKATGADIVSLTTGEPDFPTPPHIIEAAFHAARAGQTRYTTVSGTVDLKAAIIEKFRRENGLHYEPANIIIGNGGKHVLFNALMATVEAGVEVIVPAPYWISYPEIVQLAGGTPRFVRCTEATAFKLTPGPLEAAITPATRWVILNSPSNPTGAAYTAEELSALAEVLLRHRDVGVITDDMYEHILFDGRKFATIGAVCPELASRTLTLNGVSKTYAMTGWRLGYAGGPVPLIREMTKMLSQSTSAPSAISQAAAVAALTGPQDFVDMANRSFEERRDLVVSMLNQTKGLTCRKPEGAFYAFPNCAQLIGKVTPAGRKLESDTDVVLYLLENGVAAVQGSAYGLAPHFRISFATSTELLTEACRRIQRACAALR
ncbi:MAG: pyridoxal phosphate-dependent aminotransferase [Proteobacteria bacterium]|nr:pyridoxal phosphate-dependent aminotransferase [Pseudomonadota bacterium]